MKFIYHREAMLIKLSLKNGKKGFVELIVLIIFAVLMSISFFALNTAYNNFNEIYQIKNKTQSKYYAEIGLNYAIEGIKNKIFTGNRQFYLLFEGDYINVSQTQLGKRYVYIKIICTNGVGYNIYNISAKGVYNDYLTYLSEQITIKND